MLTILVQTVLVGFTLYMLAGASVLLYQVFYDLVKGR